MHAGSGCLLAGRRKDHVRKLAGRGVSAAQGFALARRYPAFAIRHVIRSTRDLLHGDRPDIRTVVFELTYRCNLCCPSCWFYGDHGIFRSGGAEPGASMTTDQAKLALDRLAGFRPLVNFTGGEPLLRNDFLDIVEHASARGLPSSVNTNGTLLDRFDTGRLLESGLISINVSLDGLGERQDRSRGKKCFDDIRRNLELLVARKRSALPLLKINSTVNNFNFDRLDETAQFAEDLGLDVFQVQHQWYLSRTDAEAHERAFRGSLGEACPFVHGYVSNAHEEIRPDVLADQIRRLKARRGRLRVECFPDFSPAEAAAYYSDAYEPDLVCRNPLRSLFIKPDGHVMPCLDYIVGNILESPIEDILRGERYRAFVGALGTCGRWPGCKRCCGLYSYAQRR